MGCFATRCEIFPKYGGNLQGKGDMFMHHTLVKWMNPNFSFFRIQAKEMYAQYVANVCTVLSPVMDYIWRHGAAYIQVPYLVGRKRKRGNWQQDSGDSEWGYGKSRHQVGASQGGGLENVIQLPRQGSSVVETRQKINSWAASHEEKWRRVTTKPEEKVQVHK